MTHGDSEMMWIHGQIRWSLVQGSGSVWGCLLNVLLFTFVDHGVFSTQIEIPKSPSSSTEPSSYSSAGISLPIGPSSTMIHGQRGSLLRHFPFVNHGQKEIHRPRERVPVWMAKKNNINLSRLVMNRWGGGGGGERQLVQS